MISREQVIDIYDETHRDTALTMEEAKSQRDDFISKLGNLIGGDE